MEEPKRVFSFLRSYYEAAKKIPDKQVQADFLMAICAYSLDDELLQLDCYASMAFELVKPVIDANKRRATKKTLASDSEVTGKSLSGDSEVTLYNMNNELRSNELRSNDNTPKVPNRGRDGFEEFWSSYPKKVGKESAKKAFQKVKEPLETLLSAIEQQKCSSQWSKDGGQYIPNPATWLNQHRWEDELEVNHGNDYGNGSGNKAKWNVKYDLSWS